MKNVVWIVLIVGLLCFGIASLIGIGDTVDSEPVVVVVEEREPVVAKEFTKISGNLHYIHDDANSVGCWIAIYSLHCMPDRDYK